MTNIQNNFNYMDWNDDSKYFMIKGVNFYIRDDSASSWILASQVNYMTGDITQWYMKMDSPTIFHHYSQDGSTNQTSSYVIINDPNNITYKVSIQNT